MATSFSIYLRLRDSTASLAKTGLTASSGGAVCSYTRVAGSATTITLVALASPTAAWTSGGFIEVDSVKAPGLYRLDLPDAAVASGVPYVVISIAFTGVIEESVYVDFVTQSYPAGTGSIAFTVTVTDSASGHPLPGAAVWVTTDLAGSTVAAGTLYTNAFGKAVFNLNAGIYYVWVQHEGYTGTNPTQITVS